MNQDELLENEQIEKTLSPHPLSFMGLQSLCIFLMVWGIVIGWLVNFSEYSELFNTSWVIIGVWGIILLVVGVIASILTIRWRIFFLYLIILVIGIGIIVWQDIFKAVGIFIPFYSISISIIGFLFVELFRRSHKYIISNQRIKFKGGIITKYERSITHDNISEFSYKQGILGQIFGFGTIIPISPSGFGLGNDTAFAAGGAQVGEKKLKLLGFFGGGKEVKTPRTRSFYELHGVYPYKEIKKSVDNYKQSSVISPYQQEQVAFQKEQVDIQKQMRDLLKKQSKSNENNMSNDDKII